MFPELFSSLIGGVLIGLAATLLLWLNGRVAGNSGIIGQCFPLNKNNLWRFFYVIGLLTGGSIYLQLFPQSSHLHYNPSIGKLIAAGLLVGFGTRLGSGCTSGHGICGLARLSPRSLTATIVFMLTGVLIVWIIRQTGGVWW